MGTAGTAPREARGYLLIGYDTEASWAPEKTLRFLDVAEKVHKELRAPCTLFVTGEVLALSPSAFQAIARDPLFEIEQHTYSHLRLKPVTVIESGTPKALDCATPAQAREDIEKANSLFRRLLGRSPLGLTGPYANLYRNGLRDAPEMLGVIHASGIRFLRCFGRPGNNLPLEVQPFWYAEQGYRDILEFPLQKTGYEGYREDISGILREAAARGYIWDNLQHDWDVAEHDPQMTGIRRLITEARDLGIEVAGYRDCYRRLDAERGSSV